MEIVVLAILLVIVGLPVYLAYRFIRWLVAAISQPSDRRQRIPIVRNERDAVAQIAPRMFPGCHMEMTLQDGSRCDILTATHAIEADWPNKVEAIAQSLWYARMTGKRPGILVLLCGRKREADESAKMQAIADMVGIDVWFTRVRKA